MTTKQVINYDYERTCPATDNSHAFFWKVHFYNFYIYDLTDRFRLM
jgi:hypothetical protein